MRHRNTGNGIKVKGNTATVKCGARVVKGRFVDATKKVKR